MKRFGSIIIGLMGSLVILFAIQIVRGQDTAVIPSSAQMSPVTAGFTYQGHLHSDGAPVNNTCDFRFLLWDTAVDGAQIGSFQEITNVLVSEGLFTVILNDANQMGADVFSGEARWLEIWVRCPAGSAGYTVLTPRQPVTATPYALSLQPGANVAGDLAAPVLTLANDTGDGLAVTAGATGLRIGHANDDGVLVCATGTESGCADNGSNNGVEVVNAEDNGLRVNAAGDHGVLVDSAGLYGFRVNNAVNAGMRVGHSDGDGLVICNTGTETSCPRDTRNNAIEIGNADDNAMRVNSTGSSGIWIQSAGSSGVVVNSTGGNGFAVNNAAANGLFVSTTGREGVYVFSSAEDGFRVCRVGNASCSNFDSSNQNGLEVGNAEDYGARVLEAGRAGFRIDNPGTNGFYAFDAGDSGIWVRDATNYAGFFGGDINVTGNCSGCRIATFGINNSLQALNPGDIVAVDGTQAGPATNTEMLLQVQAAAVGQPMVGVVSGRAELHTSSEDGTTILVSRDGAPAEPNDYVTIIIYGLVQLPAQESFVVGDRVTLADNGRIRALQTVELDGVPLAEAVPTLGMALEVSDSDGDGLVWVLVNPH